MDESGLMMVEDAASGYIFHMMTPVQFEHYWPEISAMMDKVPHTWQPHYTKEFFHSSAMNGLMQFWSGGTRELALCVVVTSIASYPGCRALQVIWAAGTGVLEESLRVGEVALEQFAQQHDCDLLEVISGRHGWEKILPSLGFKVDSTVLSRKVPKPPHRRN